MFDFVVMAFIREHRGSGRSQFEMWNSEFGIVHPSSDPRGSAGRMQAVPSGTVVYVPAIRSLCQANAECGIRNSEFSPGNRELTTGNRQLFTLDQVMVLRGRTHLTRVWVRCIRPPDPDGSGFLSAKLCSGDGSRPLRVQAPRAEKIRKV